MRSYIVLISLRYEKNYFLENENYFVVFSLQSKFPSSNYFQVSFSSVHFCKTIRFCQTSSFIQVTYCVTAHRGTPSIQTFVLLKVHFLLLCLARLEVAGHHFVYHTKMGESH